MKAISYLRFICTISFLPALSGGLDARSVDSLIKIDSFSDFQVISSKSEIRLGVSVSLAPGWHVYWKNAGDSGYPTNLEWEMPAGWQVGEVQFPAPYLYEHEGMTGYALDSNFTLFASARVPEFSKVNIGKNYTLNGTFSALVCNESTCLPYEGEISLSFVLGEKEQLDLRGLTILDNARSSLPVELPLNAKVQAVSYGNSGIFSILDPTVPDLDLDSLWLFPEDSSIKIKSPPSRIEGGAEFSWSVSDSAKRQPTLLNVLMVHPSMENGWFVSVPIERDSTFIPQKPAVSSKVFKDEYALLRLLLLMVFVAMSAWAYGRSQHHFFNSAAWRIFAFLSLLFGVFIAWSGNSDPSAKDLRWEKWTPELENELLASGQPLFVDYTAKWCLTCQVNKRVYQSQEVLNSFQQAKVRTLRADWTQRSSDILKSLQAFGREGVPFNVFYPASKKGEKSAPVLFSEILTEEDLLGVISGKKMKSKGEKTYGFFTLLLFAWVGGLILNLMPCVFPVIGLKIMGFVKQSGSNQAQVSLHGWVFTAGVVLSFWVLVVVLLVLRNGMEKQLGWGFQLQEPIFVCSLAVLLLLFGLSLSGVFEIGRNITGLGSELTQSSGLSGSFFSGILATIVATPCMAPFLGAAIGAALALSFWPSFAIFTSTALGLSTPYLILSIWPAWVERLPKPGLWMESFKQFMAFPIYATVAWLIWTLEGLL